MTAPALLAIAARISVSRAAEDVQQALRLLDMDEAGVPVSDPEFWRTLGDAREACRRLRETLA